MTNRPAESLRIIYVGTLPPHQGGSAVMASQLLAGLAVLGHEIQAIAPITNDALRSGDSFAERNPDLSVVRFTMPYLDTAPGSPPGEEYRRLEQRQIEQLFTASLGEQRPDVVVIGRESFAPHVAPLAAAQGVPSVLLFQGATTMGILGGTYPASLAERLLECFRGIDVSVASAQHMKDSLARLGIPGVRVIPNPVDLERFRPMAPSAADRRALALRPNDLVVAHPSNLKAIKRPLDFVDAAAIAAAQNDDLVFLVIGDGPLREPLENACHARRISNRFRFTGWLDHERMPSLLNCTEIVVMPSEGEAQALVYLETQACERTLIASDIPAARETVEHAQTGLLYRTGDASELAARILEAASDPDLRARLGRQARQALGRHSLPRVVSLYAELLTSAALERGPTDPRRATGRGDRSSAALPPRARDRGCSRCSSGTAS